MEALIESAKLAFLLFVLPLGVVATVAWIGDRILDTRYRRNLEPVVTSHDFDDWRDPIRDFRAEQYIRAIRRRFAVASVCGADPDKEMTAARVESPAVMTTHGGTHEQCCK